MGRYLLRILSPLVILLTACASSNKGEPKLLSLLGGDSQTTEATEGGVEKNYDALTLLRRGEQFYDKEDYAEAVGEYQRFLDLHPFHRLSPYVHYKLGMAFYHQIDTIDRDQEPVEKSLAAFQKLQSDFPRSLFSEQAQAKIADLKNRLARRELYIGRFYYKKGAYLSAIPRLQKAVEQGESPSLKAEALYYAAASQLEEGNRDEAARLLGQVLEVDPAGPFRRDAIRLQDQLHRSPSHS